MVAVAYTFSRKKSSERQRCLDIVTKRRESLLDKILHGDRQGHSPLNEKQKVYLRRVIKLLREIEYEIMEIKSAENIPVVATGDFTPEEMDRAQAILEELRNPFEV